MQPGRAINDLVIIEERLHAIKLSSKALKQAEEESCGSVVGCYSPTNCAYSPISPPYSSAPAFSGSDDESQGHPRLEVDKS